MLWKISLKLKQNSYFQTLYNFSNDEKTYTYCAANDCQNKNTTASSLDQYVPPKEGLYASLCCLILVQLAGVILHIRYIPNILLEHVNEGLKIKHTHKLIIKVCFKRKKFIKHKAREANELNIT